MRITCPQCGFFRDIPDNKVPVTSTMATCPKCRHRFKFRPEPTLHWTEERHIPESRETPSPQQEEPSSWRRHSPIHDHQAETEPRREPRPFRRSAPRPARPEADEPQEYRPLPPRRFLRDLDRETEDTPHQAPRADRVVQPPRPSEPSDREPEPRSVPARAVPPKPDEPLAVAPTRTESMRSEPLPEPEPETPPATDAAPMPPDEPTPPPPYEPTPPDEPAPTPPEPEPRAPKRSVNADGVRDIWAKLQAMDEPEPSRKDEEPSRPQKKSVSKEADTPPASDPIPWERQDIYGFFPSLLLTLRRILMHPTDFFKDMPEGRPRGKALVFNLLISEFLLLIDFFWSLVGLRPKMGMGEGDLMGAVSASPTLGFLLALLLVPPLLAIGVYLDAWLTHVLLLLFRTGKKRFSETFRVMCYSSAPTVLSAVPIAGQILSPFILLWYMALQAIGLRQIHDGGYTQILAAVFIKWSLYLFLLLAILQGVAPQ